MLRRGRCQRRGPWGIRIIGDTNSLGWRPGKQATVVFLGKNER